MSIELEPFSPSNADRVLAWRNAPQVRANSLDSSIIDRDTHLAFLSRQGDVAQNGPFIIHLSGHPVGVISLNINGTRGYWGCYLVPGDAPKPGVFVLMVLVACHLAFARFGLETLDSDVLAHNAAPLKMNDFLGIRRVGHRRVERAGKPLDVQEFRLVRDDFPHIEGRATQLLTKSQKKMWQAFREV